ncbi:MAG: hypothetical protein ACRCU9_08670 [Iodobacter sp.]
MPYPDTTGAVATETASTELQALLNKLAEDSERMTEESTRLAKESARMASLSFWVSAAAFVFTIATGGYAFVSGQDDAVYKDKQIEILKKIASGVASTKQ